MWGCRRDMNMRRTHARMRACTQAHGRFGLFTPVRRPALFTLQLLLQRNTSTDLLSFEHGTTRERFALSRRREEQRKEAAHDPHSTTNHSKTRELNASTLIDAPARRQVGPRAPALPHPPRLHSHLLPLPLERRAMHMPMRADSIAARSQPCHAVGTAAPAPHRSRACGCDENRRARI